MNGNKSAEKMVMNTDKEKLYQALQDLIDACRNTPMLPESFDKLDETISKARTVIDEVVYGR